MAPDERDRSFDKALARHLRSAAPAGEVAGMPGVPASQGGACPDPETLAAYHERALLPEQLNSLKEHIVGCANCQTVLAHLETTDEISLQAAQQAEDLAVKESEPASATPSKKSRRLLLLRGARWQWLAPAGALAAGLLVWVALHENQPLPLPTLSQNEDKVAQNRVPAAPLPSVSTGVPQSPASSKPAPTLTRPQSSVGDYAISNGRGVAEATKQSQTLGKAAEIQSPKPLDDREFSARKDGARDTSTDQLTAANQVDLDAKKLPDALRKREEEKSRAANTQADMAPSQNAQAQNQYNSAPQKMPGPSPLNQAEAPRKSKAAVAAAPPPPQPGAVGGVVSNYNESASLEVASAISNPRLISPPGSRVLWRAGRSGLIELSKNGGSSWSRQTSGVLADLLTGSSPSDKVCWIVGRVGAILLTTDGGAHWTLISSPLSEDLGGIHATDALHATIWNARNNKSFVTSDGGVTWKAAPHP